MLSHNLRRLNWIAVVVLCLLTSELSKSLFAQSGAAPQGPVSESTKATTTKEKPKIDRRYAISSGAWSAATISLFNTWTALDSIPSRHASFYSPDHKKLVEIVGDNVNIWIGGQTFGAQVNNFVKHDAELGWAPDSSKFFVTWSESGELGPWHMQVYSVDGSGVHEFPKVEEPARKDFEQRVRQWPIDPELDNPQDRTFWQSSEYCEPYHVIGGRWLNGSQELLLSVLIRNTGDCRYSSEFNVYRVNAVTGEVLERFTAAQAHKRFGGKYLPLITR
jgi:hypothetical protein